MRTMIAQVIRGKRLITMIWGSFQLNLRLSHNSNRSWDFSDLLAQASQRERSLSRSVNEVAHRFFPQTIRALLPDIGRVNTALLPWRQAVVVLLLAQPGQYLFVLLSDVAKQTFEGSLGSLQELSEGLGAFFNDLRKLLRPIYFLKQGLDLVPSQGLLDDCRIRLSGGPMPGTSIIYYTIPPEQEPVDRDSMWQ